MRLGKISGKVAKLELDNIEKEHVYKGNRHSEHY